MSKEKAVVFILDGNYLLSTQTVYASIFK